MVVNGRRFSDKEIEKIVREYLSNKMTPKVEQPFEVNPLEIDRDLFKMPRKNPKQERTRKLIVEAFDQMDRNPKYKKTFYTLMPEKTWDAESISEMVKIAGKRGKMATWIHQALEWAQRIQNGASWEELCNKPDSANWFRIIRWKTNYRIVGGARVNYDWAGYSPANVDEEVLKLEILVEDSIPLIII